MPIGSTGLSSVSGGDATIFRSTALSAPHRAFANMKTCPPFWFEPAPWIDGVWRRPDRHGGDAFAVRNPATGRLLADVGRAGADTVTAAIDGAARAARGWRDTPAAVRGEILKAAAALLLARRDDLARLLTSEQGKPYAQAAGEVDYAMLLVGLGLRTLSVTSSTIPALKRFFRSVSVAECERVAKKALTMDSDVQVAALLRDRARQLVPAAFDGRGAD